MSNDIFSCFKGKKNNGSIILILIILFLFCFRGKNCNNGYINPCCGVDDGNRVGYFNKYSVPSNNNLFFILLIIGLIFLLGRRDNDDDDYYDDDSHD